MIFELDCHLAMTGCTVGSMLGAAPGRPTTILLDECKLMGACCLLGSTEVLWPWLQAAF